MESIFFWHDSKIDHRPISAVKHIPKTVEPRGVVLISHGMGDYKERYSHFSAELCRNGFAVYLHDHRGHGETAAADNSFGKLTVSSGWFTAVSDLLALFNLMREDYPDTPAFLLGHSLGSFIAMTFAIKWGPLLDGVLLSGTGFPSPLTLKSGKVAVTAANTTFGPDKSLLLINTLCFAGYALSVKNPKTEFDWICSDPDVVARFISDPKSQILYSNGFFLELIKGLNFNSSPDNLKLIPKQLPFYFFSGSEDPVGDNTKGVRKLAGLLSATGIHDVTTKFYEGLRHEVLNETERVRVYSDLIEWLNLRLTHIKNNSKLNSI